MATTPLNTAEQLLRDIRLGHQGAGLERTLIDRVIVFLDRFVEDLRHAEMVATHGDPADPSA